MRDEKPEPTNSTQPTEPTPYDLGPAQRLRTEVDLARWATFIHQSGNDRSTLWLLMLDADDRSLPDLIAIENVEPGPHPVFIEQLLELVETVLDEQAPGGSLVAMLERPGTPHRTATDHAWNENMREEARQRGIPVRAFFVANAGQILSMTLDDAA